MTTTPNDNSNMTNTTSPRENNVDEMNQNKDTTTLEQNFFFGLTIDDALKTSENLRELFYNACKYNHLELVKRCVEEKQLDVNEPFNSDFALCIAR